MEERWRVRAWAAASVAATCLALTVFQIVERMATPSDGTIVQLSNRPWTGDKLIIDRVLDPRDGLKVGDAVVAIDGAPVSTQRNQVASEALRRGGVMYTVSRGDSLFDLDVQLRSFPILDLLRQAWAALVALAALGCVAIFVFLRRPREPAAADLLAIAGLMGFGTISWLLGSDAVGWVAAGPSATQIAGEVALAGVWGVALHFLLLVAGRTRLAGPTGLLACLSVPLLLHLGYLAATLPSADGTAEAEGRIVQISLLPSTVLPAGTALVLLGLFLTTAQSAVRSALGLLLASVTIAAVAWQGVWVLLPRLSDTSRPDVALIPLVMLPVVLALAAAILRHRIIDVELVLGRSLVYAALTVAVLSIYVVTTWAMNRLWGAANGTAVLVASVLVALTIQPLGARLRRRIWRLIYGDRDEPDKVVRGVDRVRGAADPRDLLNGVVEVLASSLRLTYAEIELHSRQGGVLRAVHGSSAHRPVEVALDGGRGAVGRLVLDAGRGREPFGRGDDQLLRALQRQLSDLAANVLLTEDLRASRERIVLAREEERRELHNRLHDGVGAGLAAGVMQLEVAKQLIRADPDRASELLSRSIESARQLLTDLRRTVYGLRPAALDQLGLEGAIRARVDELVPSPQHRPRISVSVEDGASLTGLPAAVEVAAYWIASEAAHNVVKHAQASVCRIELSRNAALLLQITDDGRGLREAVPGSGFRSMTDRAEELGGSLSTSVGTLGGTTISVRIPIPDGKVER